MLGSSNFPGHQGFQIASWILGIPGLILSYYTAVTYIPTIRASLREGREDRPLVCVAMTVPAHLLYSSDHEWVAVDGNRARIGITDYAQEALGDVVFVQVPTVGAKVAAGDSFSEVESTKSVSDIYAPGVGNRGRGQRRIELTDRTC